MSKHPRCIWCLKPVANPGDVCNEDCYTEIAAVLALGMPYLKDGDDPPNTATDQPWYIDPRKEDT